MRAGALGAPRQQIDREIADGEARRLGRPRGAPDERLDAREELCERERFGQIVVAARLQAAHAVVDGALRAEDEHRRSHAARAQAIDERQAVECRQHDVDNRGVVRMARRHFESAIAIRGDIDNEAGFGQALLHEIGNRRVVFDEEDPHRRFIAWRRVARTARR